MSRLLNSLPINLVVLVSGAGTSLQNLVDVIARGELRATIKLVIGSRDELPAEGKVKAARLPYEVTRRRDFDSVEAFSSMIFTRCDHACADLVVCAGWLNLLAIPRAFESRVINIHPALLPKFGGKGMFGRHVHEAVLAAGEAVSGCTVHFLDNHYDNGPVILQRECEVRPDDTPESLAARVQAQERIALPQAIRMLAELRARAKS